MTLCQIDDSPSAVSVATVVELTQTSPLVDSDSDSDIDSDLDIDSGLALRSLPRVPVTSLRSRSVG